MGCSGWCGAAKDCGELVLVGLIGEKGLGDGLPGPFFLCALAAHGRVAGRLGPVGDLLEGLGEGVDDDVGLAVAEAFDGQLGSLFGIFGSVPQANDDAVVGKVRTNALTDGAGLREGEGRQGGDEDDGIGLVGEGVEDLAGD